MEQTEMNMEKKGLFAGFRDVMSFTASQNAKASNFKVTTIALGIVFALVFAAISIIMAAVQLDDKDDDASSGSQDVVVEEGTLDDLKDVSNVYLVRNEEIENEYFNGLISAAMPLTGLVETPLNVLVVSDEDAAKKAINEDGNALYVTVDIFNEDDITFCAYINETSSIGYEVVDLYMEHVIMLMKSLSYASAGITAQADIMVLEAPYFTQSLATNKEAEGMAVTLTEMLVPVAFSLIMYLMIAMNSQSISKSVISEKSSKLMEFLLTSIRPYGLIAGKIVALVGMALIQLFVWVACAVGGYIVGGIVAEQINSDYINYVDLIMDYMKMEDALAFSIPSVILAILAVIFGFTLYCVLAALVASCITKIEEMSSVMSIYQIPVMIGWMAAYIGPLLMNDTINTVINVVPFTSPFCLPVNLLLGKCSLVEGLISLSILGVLAVVVVIFTGKIYKGKVFNRK
ncbi:MAG: ABC transporter permease [Lachnospiraceae bacterium]|nr:ABC transporter permease [Lachnospiraceae bacterium]